jgi:hypothetical protein
MIEQDKYSKETLSELLQKLLIENRYPDYLKEDDNGDLYIKGCSNISLDHADSNSNLNKNKFNMLVHEHESDPYMEYNRLFSNTHHFSDNKDCLNLSKACIEIHNNTNFRLYYIELNENKTSPKYVFQALDEELNMSYLIVSSSKLGLMYVGIIKGTKNKQVTANSLLGVLAGLKN